jgi:hypothetical protein
MLRREMLIVGMLDLNEFCIMTRLNVNSSNVLHRPTYCRPTPRLET